MTRVWVVEKGLRVPAWSLYVAHISAGVDDSGTTRILCDPWGRLAHTITPTQRTPHCLACGLAAFPRTPKQLTIYDALEAMA